MFLDSHRTVLTFLSWLDLLSVVVAFWISIQKSSNYKLLTQGYICYKLRKTFGKLFRSYSELSSKFGEISFQEYVSEGISHPVPYDDLVYKLRRVKCEANFVSPGSKIVKCLRHRNYDPAIIERTIGHVLGPSTALYRSFQKHSRRWGLYGRTCRNLLRGDKAPNSSPLIACRDSFSPLT